MPEKVNKTKSFRRLDSPAPTIGEFLIFLSLRAAPPGGRIIFNCTKDANIMNQHAAANFFIRDVI